MPHFTWQLVSKIAILAINKQTIILMLGAKFITAIYQRQIKIVINQPVHTKVKQKLKQSSTRMSFYLPRDTKAVPTDRVSETDKE